MKCKVTKFVLATFIVVITGCTAIAQSDENDAMVSEPFMSAEIVKESSLNALETEKEKPKKTNDEELIVEVDDEAVKGEDLDQDSEEDKVVLNVKRGTIEKNLLRFSQVNGWHPPLWKSQKEIMTYGSYEIEAPTFEEAIQIFLSKYRGVQATISRLDKVILVK